MSGDGSVIEQISSGGVIVRGSKKSFEVCLILRTPRPQYNSPDSGWDIWCFPKGHVEEKEDLQTTALREVREETGIYGEIIAPLDSIQYTFKQENTKFNKTVWLFLMRAVSGDINDADSREVREARWMSLDEAQSKLAYENERKILRKAMLALEDEQICTRIEMRE